MAGEELFDRAYVLNINGTLIKGGPNGVGFQTRFVVKRTLKPEPNTLELDVWNLSKDTRAALALPKLPIQLDAGYASGTTIFIGNISNIQTRRDGPDVIVKIWAGDGAQTLRSARVNVSTPPAKAAPPDLFSSVVKSLGVSSGNADSMASKFDAALNAKLAKLGKVGSVFSGSAPRHMNAISRSTGLEWSVQGDKLQVLQRRKALDGTAIVLDAAHGLIGSPTVETKGKTAGRVKARALMLKDALPGRIVQIKSEFVTGNYRIEATTHTGDFRGTDWFCDLEGSPY